MTPSNTHTVALFTAPFSAQQFTHLDITVRHDKAGFRGFDWSHQAAGHRLSFSPCRIENSFRRSVMLGEQWESGFYIRIDEATRKNPHFIKRVRNLVANRLDELRAAYEARESGNLQRIAIEITTQAQCLTGRRRTLNHVVLNP